MFYLVFIFMPITIYMAFMFAPAASILGDTSRIIYFHVPLAWVSVLAFIVSGVLSIVNLADSKKKYKFLEERAYNSAVIGIVFTILATVTGSIWAKMMWGSYWNWDPRETSILVLILIYIAYFSLHAALEENSNKGRVLSSYLIFAMVTVPFFIFIIPRLSGSTLHPETIINQKRKIHMEADMRITLLFGIFAFSTLYYSIYKIMNKITKIENKIEESYDDE